MWVTKLVKIGIDLLQFLEDEFQYQKYTGAKLEFGFLSIKKIKFYGLFSHKIRDYRRFSDFVFTFE